MTTLPRHEPPMNPILRARLGLDAEARFLLYGVRAALRTLDMVSQVTTGRPFFGLKPGEAILQQIAGLTGPALVDALLQQGGQTNLDIAGHHHVPITGPAIIAATHPTGLLDYVAHASALMTHRTDVKVVATAEAKQFLSDDALISVDVDKPSRARSGRATVKAMEHHLSNGGLLLVFGSGRVAQKTGAYLIEEAWRGGPTHVSRRCNAPIIPAALNAWNTPYYYTMRRWAERMSRSAQVGAQVASIRHFAEFMEKLGGRYSLIYGPALPPGTPPEVIKATAEGVIPGLYRKG